MALNRSQKRNGPSPNLTTLMKNQFRSFLTAQRFLGLSLFLSAGFCFAAPQQDWGRLLLSSGDTVSNGQTVRYIQDAHVTDDAGWAALVFPNGHTPNEGYLVVQDGQVTHAPGTVLAGGEVIEAVWNMDCDSEGNLVVGAGLSSVTALVVNDELILRGATPISGVGFPAGSTLDRIDTVRISWPFVLTFARVSLPGRPNLQAALRLDLSTPGQPAVKLLAAMGDPIPFGTIFFFDSNPTTMGISSDGSYAIFANLASTQGGPNRAVITNNGLMVANGSSTPFAGTNWDSVNPYISLAGNGQLAISTGIVENPRMGLPGGVAGPAGGLLRTGDPIPGITGLAVAEFGGHPVDLDPQTLEVAYVVPTFSTQTGGRRGNVLMVDSQVVLFDETGFTTLPPVHMLGVEFADEGKLLIVRTRTSQMDSLFLRERSVGDPVNCPVTPNSTGMAGNLLGMGTRFVSANDLTLQAVNLPAGQFGLLLASKTQGFSALPAGSQGNLCLGGSLGRFNNMVQASNAGGVIAFPINLSLMPTPTGPVAAMAGETWFFQTWHRDRLPSGASTSNFSAALSVQLH